MLTLPDAGSPYTRRRRREDAHELLIRPPKPYIRAGSDAQTPATVPQNVGPEAVVAAGAAASVQRALVAQTKKFGEILKEKKKLIPFHITLPFYRQCLLPLLLIILLSCEESIGMGMSHLDLTHSLADAFNALADEAQSLNDRRVVLEHKLRFAHEQVSRTLPLPLPLASPF